MRQMPPPPPVSAPDFGSQLAAWLKDNKVRQADLARWAGIDRQQILRWTSGKPSDGAKQQKPKGTAAARYEALRTGQAAAQIAQEISELAARLAEVQQISFGPH